MQQSISYNGFQLDVHFQFVRQKGSRDLYYFNGFTTTVPPGSFAASTSNQPVTLINNRWQKPGDNAEFARYTSRRRGIAILPLLSDVWYSYDASFIRLKNLSLSWQLPAQWLQHAHIQTARLYFQGQNLLTITNYTGLDPENRSTRSLPPLQLWTVGVNMEL